MSILIGSFKYGDSAVFRYVFFTSDHNQWKLEYFFIRY